MENDQLFVDRVAIYSPKLSLFLVDLTQIPSEQISSALCHQRALSG